MKHLFHPVLPVLCLCLLGSGCGKSDDANPSPHPVVESSEQSTPRPSADVRKNADKRAKAKRPNDCDLVAVGDVVEAFSGNVATGSVSGTGFKQFGLGCDIRLKVEGYPEGFLKLQTGSRATFEHRRALAQAHMPQLMQPVDVGSEAYVIAPSPFGVELFAVDAGGRMANIAIVHGMKPGVMTPAIPNQQNIEAAIQLARKALDGFADLE